MAPRHNKAARFLRSKLFDGPDSFTTLEQRIADLPTRKEARLDERGFVWDPHDALTESALDAVDGSHHRHRDASRYS